MDFHTKQLLPETWVDFERLFTRGNGWDHCWCMAFQRDRVPSSDRLNRTERGRLNREAKRALVCAGKAHGILVYREDEPVGWCQFGPARELRAPGPQAGRPEAESGLWRITCFVTDKPYRRTGVAGTALTAALEAIRGYGGQTVEAYPVVHWHSDHELAGLIREFGVGSPEAALHKAERRAPERLVDGVGPVPAAHGSFGNVSTHGTLSMFQRAGFEAVAAGRRGHVVVRRNLD